MHILWIAAPAHHTSLEYTSLHVHTVCVRCEHTHRQLILHCKQPIRLIQMCNVFFDSKKSRNSHHQRILENLGRNTRTRCWRSRIIDEQSRIRVRVAYYWSCVANLCAYYFVLYKYRLRVSIVCHVADVCLLWTRHGSRRQVPFVNLIIIGSLFPLCCTKTLQHTCFPCAGNRRSWKNHISGSMIDIHLPIWEIRELCKTNLWTRFGSIMIDGCRVS